VQNVESRIKFLVERDKKNSRLQKELEAQNRKIDQLEQRQERLLMRQYQQAKEVDRQCFQSTQIRVTSPSHAPPPCNCCSSDEEITSRLL
jgi:predicted RNase H-like nuclease (RuvC/YqgF family)